MPEDGTDLTLREAELQLRAELEWRSGHLREHELLADAHREKHASEQKAVDKAEAAQQAAIDAALKAVGQAGDAQRGLVKNSLDDHHREHLTHEASHAREHTLVGDALSKAENAMDKRLEGITQLFGERDKAYAERFEGVLRMISAAESSLSQRFADTAKHTDDRYEDNRKRIETIEKGDVSQVSKAEGRSLGQGTVIAIIVGAVGFVGTLLGIIVVLANLATT